MFLQIPSNFRNLWAYYQLANNAGEIVNVGISRFVEITQLTDIIPPEGLFLSVLDTDEDQFKLANRAISDVANRGKPSMQWTIKGIVTAWQKGGRAAKSVRCVETGEIFASANAAANAHKLSYSQLINHLNKKIGFRTVKNNHYEWV